MARQKLARGGAEKTDAFDGCGGGVLKVVDLKRASATDVAGMHHIRATVRENVLSNEAAITVEDYVRFLEREGETWIASIDSQLAGFGVLDRLNQSIWALFVAPTFESHGIGKTLLARLVERAEALGMRNLSLTTTAGTRAEQFYIRQGWQPNGVAPNGEIQFTRQSLPV